MKRRNLNKIIALFVLAFIELLTGIIVFIKYGASDYIIIYTDIGHCIVFLEFAIIELSEDRENKQ